MTLPAQAKGVIWTMSDMETPEDDHAEDLFRDLCHNIMELCVHVGLFGTVSSQWPLHVQANWVQRLQAMIEWVNQQIEEIQTFAEAFDEESDDEE